MTLGELVKQLQIKLSAALESLRDIQVMLKQIEDLNIPLLIDDDEG